MKKNKPKLKLEGSPGVSFDKHSRKWKAFIKKDKENICLGFFSSEYEASIAYIKKAFKLYGVASVLDVI